MSQRQGYFRAREIAELTGLSLRTVKKHSRYGISVIPNGTT